MRPGNIVNMKEQHGHSLKEIKKIKKELEYFFNLYLRYAKSCIIPIVDEYFVNIFDLIDYLNDPEKCELLEYKMKYYESNHSLRRKIKKSQKSTLSIRHVCSSKQEYKENLEEAYKTLEDFGFDLQDIEYDIFFYIPRLFIDYFDREEFRKILFFKLKNRAFL